MKIKAIKISNFRRIHNAEINMEEDITVIAGANNSGKTSLIELFNFAFCNGKGKLCYDDLPVLESQKWSDRVYSQLHSVFVSGKSKEDIISNIIEIIVSPDNPSNALPMPTVEMKIQVDYDPSKDDIRNFVDYIMELDPSNTSFYFIYRYELNINSFRKVLDSEYEKLLARFKRLTGDPEKDKDAIRIIKEMFALLYTNACAENAYFSDKSFSNVVLMDLASFKALFNYQNIMAGRTLDDESSDRVKILSKNMIDIASQEDDWKELIRGLPEQIIQPIQGAHIREKVHKTSIDTLSDTMEQISKTNGGQAGNIVIDMNVTEEAVHSLLKNITSAKYQIDDFYLRESSQGLGYSNLIYIHLQLEKFKKSIDPLVVNFFVIEEPEAHMHPQMQNVFAQYLFEYYKRDHGIQGILTTHSHEIVRTADIAQLRVLRQTGSYSCKLFDLRKFQTQIQSDKDLVRLYNGFYTINFPDIIFANKIILYEGDTERMLIKNALLLKEFEELRSQYISYVQVGGAYAFKYKPIIDFLGIKSVIITDLDYGKDLSDMTEILTSNTTNPTINKFAETELGDSRPTVQKLYDWQSNGPIVVEKIYLAFQGKKDNFARTLEEAMLAQLHGVSALDIKPKDEWTELQKEYKLEYVLPKKSSFNIRTIVMHTSNAKTDFMYSVILNGLVDSMLPAYIKEALLWLAK